ncbi:MAG TPA: hypothetical protein VFY51_06385 [Pyrinomonadaceae bacterium]|nr:hypothetical protein [Pyrinomonadaceae bacterium]
MTTTHRLRKSVFVVSGLLVLLATEALGQSGRRAPKPPQTPVTTPQTENDAKPRASGRELKHKVSLVVAREPSSYSLLSEEAIYASFVAQLKEFANVSVTDVGQLKRDYAVKRAKKETEAAVILVQYDVDEFQAGSIIVNPQDMDVKIFVFSPQTGQKKFEGKVYYKSAGGPMLRRDNWPTGTPVRMTTEAVGIEAAEQVRDWLIVEEQKKKP